MSNATVPIAARLDPDIISQLRTVAVQNDRTVSQEIADAIRRHLEGPDMSGDVRFDARELVNIIRERNAAYGIPPDAAEAMVQQVLECVEEAQRRRRRQAADLVYGPVNGPVIAAAAERVATTEAARRSGRAEETVADGVHVTDSRRRMKS